jgi:ATP-binding cassette subfamily C protein
VLTAQSIEDVLPTLALFGYAGLRTTGAITRINVALQNLRRNVEEFTEYYDSVSQFAPDLFGGDRDDAVPTYLAEEKPLPKGRDGRLRRALMARNVTYTYPGAHTPAIDDASFEIPKGSFVSFCGPSGGGKSTLMRLLLGLLRPQHGEIICDDWSIHEHIRAWHKNVGYVGQQFYLSGRSIRENVAFAVPESKIENERVWKALKLASAARFVRRLPKRLNYNLQDGGSNLSGGQRQRLVIARALYHDPDVVFFDEATAALDNVTERRITQAIAGLTGEKTVICVAHRLSTIQKSDKIYVVKRGRIVASGTYDELLESSKTFRRLALVTTET